MEKTYQNIKRPKEGAITFRIKSVICHNCGFTEPCDFFDKQEEYYEKPCPTCSKSLYTEKERKSLAKMVRFVDVINSIFFLVKPKEDEKFYKVVMATQPDGTVEVGEVTGPEEFKKEQG